VFRPVEGAEALLRIRASKFFPIPLLADYHIENCPDQIHHPPFKTAR
jgi:hypothetical protein